MTLLVFIYVYHIDMNIEQLPSKHFLFSKTSSRRLEDVFSVTLFVFQTSGRRLQNVFAIHLPKTSSRRRGRQKNVTLKTFSRRLQYVFTKTNVCWVMSCSKKHNLHLKNILSSNNKSKQQSTFTSKQQSMTGSRCKYNALYNLIFSYL